MPKLKNNNKTLSKALQMNSSSSQGHFSEQEQQASVLQVKKQQKNDKCKQIKKIEKVQASGQVSSKIQPSRLPVMPPKNNKKQTKKRNKNNLNECEQNIKKQQRKRSAAPPQLVTQSSKSNSSKSEKLQTNSQPAAPQQPNESSRLYIGNLPLELNQNQIRKLFKKFGNLKQVQLMINSTTGKSKGFGFVEYFQIKSAIKAKYELSQHILDGLKIKIQFCKSQ